MAYISGLSSSSTASLYGNRNVLSGLASGMDTESMIENAVSGYKLKITALQQKQTKVLWQQEAYRSISDKLANFTQKYTSYTSNTNLLSGSFFNSAVTAVANGTYADKVSATGKTSSDVQLLGVKQLATAAAYKTSPVGVDGTIQGAKVDLAADYKVSSISGSLTLTRGTQTVDLTFAEDKIYKNQDELLADIQEQLKAAGQEGKIKAELGSDGNITFSDATSGGNSVTITGASGSIKEKLDVDPSAKSSSLNVSGLQNETDFYTGDGTVGGALSGKEISITLDGVTRKITLPTMDGATTGETFLKDFQTEIDNKFGTGKIKIDTTAASGGAFTLKMNAVSSGSTLAVSGGKMLGLDSDNETSYLNTGKTLGDVLGDLSSFDKAAVEGDPANFKEVKDKDGTVTHYLDEKGNKLAKADDQYYRVDDKGAALYEFQVNGEVVGNFSENTALESVMTAINNHSDVKVSYSKTTNQFQFAAKETGAQGKIEFTGLSAQLFGDTKGKVTDGKDAVFTMKVNDQPIETSRSTNTFDVDGLKLSLKGTFNYEANGTLAADAEAVTFTASTDTDKILDAVKSMVEDYNAMVKEIKNAYSTLPAQKTNGSRYEPLTDEDQEDMTESAIKAYEEKAKQGLLFGNRDLSNLYSALTSAVNPSGEDGASLRAIGIETSYSNGLTTLTLDEGKLRSALESDPEQVKSLFTKAKSNGATRDGLMQSLKTQLDKYGSTTGTKGILVEYAGSAKAPVTLNNNTLQSQLDDFEEQIDRWTTKMSDQVDYYTSKFTQLEKLISEMNSQSSALFGLMGG